MPQLSLPNGLVIDYPATMAVRDRLARGGLGALGAPVAPPGDPLLDLIAGLPDFALLADLDFTADGGVAGLGAMAAGGGEVRIDVPLDPTEGAVVLTDDDGLLRWELPEPDDHVVAGLGAAAAPRRAVFRGRAPSVDPTGGPAGLGLDLRAVLKPLRKLVLRFVAHQTAVGVSQLLERGLREGPTVLRRGADGTWAWADLARFDQLGGPPPRRVLLCVHGTFSNSVGSFGGLCTPANAAVGLEQIAHRYDAIIGYDHSTLRATVPENAVRMATALAQLPGTAVTCDALAFSRGGLVLRWLAEVERVFTGRLRLDRAVFVGCTNHGTLLAEPAQWVALVNLYTNLIAGAARLAVLVGGPGAAAPAATISGAIKGLLSFVQWLAVEGIDGGAVPGLASMAPDGTVVARLNGADAPPLAEPAMHYVCEADFDHRLFDDTGLRQRGLGKRLFLDVADALVDRLFGQTENDLVVDRPSMSHLATWLPADRRAPVHRFAPTDGVYHTIYFDDPRVARLLAGWLG